MKRQAMNWQVFQPKTTKTARTKMAQIFAPHSVFAVVAGIRFWKQDLSHGFFSCQPSLTTKRSVIFSTPATGRTAISISFFALRRFKFSTKKTGAASPQSQDMLAQPACLGHFVQFKPTF
jgi:hypothetical protein